MCTPTLVSTAAPYWNGGIELGLYLFLANLCQITGLQSVPADRAGFLVQLTTVLVPVLDALVVVLSGWTVPFRTFEPLDVVTKPRIRIPPSTWMACGLALIGILIFDTNLDDVMHGISTTTGTTPATTKTVSTRFQNIPNIIGTAMGHIGTGDCWILAAAVLYSWHVVRLGRYAPVCDALPLATSKATVEAILSIGLVTALWTVNAQDVLEPVGPATITTAMTGFLQYVTAAGQDLNAFVTSLSTILASNGLVDTITIMMPALGAILWTGWVTCAYTIFAQSYGQSRVPPTPANLVYSIQPLGTAFFAYVLLGETLSPSGVVGAAFIAAAVYIVAVVDPGTDVME